jgi:hypothetical protein
MTRPYVAVAVCWALCSGPALADEPLSWLVGSWTEEARKKGRDTQGPPGALRIEVGEDVLRIVEGVDDVNDVRCRVDGSETRYRQTKRSVVANYALRCKVGHQSVEVSGRLVAISGSGNPPVLFELRKKYQLAKDGALEVRDRMTAPIGGVIDMTLIDEKSRFRRTP